MRSSPSWGLIALLALIPLPFAGVDPWARAAFAIAAALLLAGTLRAGAFLRLDRRSRGWLWTCVTASALLLVWASLQTFPFVANLLAFSTPPFDRGLVEASGQIPAIALAPDTAWTQLLTISGLVVLFAVSTARAQSAKEANWLLGTVAFATTLYAAYGLLVHFSGAETVLWVEKQAYRGWVTGPFVNRNSFATYLGLGLLTISAFLIHRLKRVGQGRVGVNQLIGGLDDLRFADWLLLAAFPIVGAALLLTGSRAGTTATALALLVLVLLLGSRGGARWRVGALVLLVGVGLAALHFGEAVGIRLVDTLTNSGFGTRREIYAVTLELIAQRPLAGYGLGGFPDAFAWARGISLIGADNTFAEAHSDYLELAIELGLPATIIACASLAAVALRCAIGALTRRRRRIFPAVAASASVLVGAHATVDFSLQIPAVAVTYAVLLGLGLSQSFPQRSRSAVAAAGTAGESRSGPAPRFGNSGETLQGAPAQRRTFQDAG